MASPREDGSNLEDESPHQHIRTPKVPKDSESTRKVLQQSDQTDSTTQGATQQKHCG